MKEDVLEQVVEDYLHLKGYFTRHNLRFRPDPEHPEFISRDDSVPSDVDVVGINPKANGVGRVWVVSCKSWQVGFNAEGKLKEMRGEKKNPKRATWRHFRELWVPKWNEAFRQAVEDETGARDFTYSLAVTKLTGSFDAEASAKLWREDPTIARESCGLRVLVPDHAGDVGRAPGDVDDDPRAERDRAAGSIAEGSGRRRLASKCHYRR